MSKLFKDKNILGKTSGNRFGKVAEDFNRKRFEEWMENYLDVSNNSFMLHNITSFKTDPPAIIYDGISNIQIPLNIFRNSPMTIRYIKSLSDKEVHIFLRSPSVLFSDTSRKSYVLTEDDVEIIELMEIIGNVKEIDIISHFDKCKTFERLIKYLLAKYPTANIKVNYTNKFADDLDLSIASYVMNSEYKEIIDIDFIDTGVLLDNTLTTVEDDNLVFIKGE